MHVESTFPELVFVVIPLVKGELREITFPDWDSDVNNVESTFPELGFPVIPPVKGELPLLTFPDWNFRH